MIRFFVDADDLGQNTIVLTGENASHAKVLRLKADEEVLVCDGQGREALCIVSDPNGNDYVLEVKELRESLSEASVSVSIYMALPKADKWLKIAILWTGVGSGLFAIGITSHKHVIDSGKGKE